MVDRGRLHEVADSEEQNLLLRRIAGLPLEGGSWRREGRLERRGVGGSNVEGKALKDPRLGRLLEEAAEHEAVNMDDVELEEDRAKPEGQELVEPWLRATAWVPRNLEKPHECEAGVIIVQCLGWRRSQGAARATGLGRSRGHSIVLAEPTAFCAKCARFARSRLGGRSHRHLSSIVTEGAQRRSLSPQQVTTRASPNHWRAAGLEMNRLKESID